MGSDIAEDELLEPKFTEVQLDAGLYTQAVGVDRCAVHASNSSGATFVSQVFPVQTEGGLVLTCNPPQFIPGLYSQPPDPSRVTYNETNPYPDLLRHAKMDEAGIPRVAPDGAILELKTREILASLGKDAVDKIFKAWVERHTSPADHTPPGEQGGTQEVTTEYQFQSELEMEDRDARGLEEHGLCHFPWPDELKNIRDLKEATRDTPASEEAKTNFARAFSTP